MTTENIFKDILERVSNETIEQYVEDEQMFHIPEGQKPKKSEKVKPEDKIKGGDSDVK